MLNDYLFTLAADGSRNAAVTEDLGFWFEVEGIGEATLDLTVEGFEDVEALEEAVNEKLEKMIEEKFTGDLRPLVEPFRVADFEALDPECSDDYRDLTVDLVNGLLDAISSDNSRYAYLEAADKIDALVEAYGLDVLLKGVDLDDVEWLDGWTLEEVAKEMFDDCCSMDRVLKDLGNLAIYVDIDYEALANDLAAYDGYTETRRGVLRVQF